MRYMLMIYGNHKAWNSLTQDEIDDIGRTHKSLQRELAGSGELVDHKELVTDGSKVVRTVHNAPVVSDGPFTEGEQILGGYYLGRLRHRRPCDSDRRLFPRVRLRPNRGTPTQRRNVLGH